MFNVYVQWLGDRGHAERQLVYQTANLEAANAWMAGYDLDDWEGSVHMVIQGPDGSLVGYRGDGVIKS